MVENEQEFKLVYDFLDKTCDESLYQSDIGRRICEYPALILAKTTHGNIFEWNTVRYRNKNKILVKFNGSYFTEVYEDDEGIKPNRENIKNDLISQLYNRLGLDLEVCEEFKKISNIIPRKMVEELKNKSKRSYLSGFF